MQNLCKSQKKSRFQNASSLENEVNFRDFPVRKNARAETSLTEKLLMIHNFLQLPILELIAIFNNWCAFCLNDPTDHTVKPS